MPTRSVAWAKEPAGCEFAEITLERDRLNAHGVAIAASPLAYRLDYVLETGPGFLTTLLDVSARGEGWSRRLVLRRTSGDAGVGAGSWSIDTEIDDNDDHGVNGDGTSGLRLPPPGGDPTLLTGALDCDLGLSPVTNLMPILRHGLQSAAGQVELTMAWVSVPDLRVKPDGQRYTNVGEKLIRYDALDGSFSATITVDDDGLVTDYPGIARRL